MSTRAIAFIDLCGFTSFTERHGDEQVVLVLAELRAGLRDAAARARAGWVPGPEGSIGKLAFTNGLQHLGEIAAMLLGPSLSAKSGAWGTYEWTELVTGTPGLRIAGGTDEIQRNAIAERVLGLPREPR